MKYVLFLVMILFSGQAVAINCAQAPDCAELGYSNVDDPNCKKDGYLYCPFDFNYKKCVELNCQGLGYTNTEKSGWCSEIITCPQDSSYTACNCLKSRCNIGDVFYADGSCGDVKDYTEEKVAVGVVYDTNCAGGGKVINLHDLGKESETSAFDPENPYKEISTWNGYHMDIPELKNWDHNTFLQTVHTEDRDNEFWTAGKKYTDIIVKALENNLQYAAPAAKAFYPPKTNPNNPIVGKGKWYLPTIGEQMDLYGYNYSAIVSIPGNTGATGITKDKVNTTLKVLKDKKVIAETFSGYYWSSTESTRNDSWSLSLDQGTRNDSPERNHHIRVSLEF